jgi:chromosome segregation ATPase
MRIRGPGRAVLLSCAMLAVGQARAQESTGEERLREALRQTTIQLRAVQDNQATLTAQIDQLKQERDSLQQQLTAAKNAPRPPDAELGQLRDAVAALQQQNAALQAGLQKWQGGYQQAADLARAKDAESRERGAALQQQNAKLGVCVATNGKLIVVADDILHLYHTQSFRDLLLGSYEPLLGFKKVQLENLVQDYEDKIDAQRLSPGAPVAQAPAPTQTGTVQRGTVQTGTAQTGTANTRTR